MQRQEQTRIVALIDIDGTLMKMGKDRDKPRLTLNLPLLQALKEQGIYDIQLFSNMSMDTLVNEFNRNSFGMHRKQIVDELKAMGFKVHALITPGDVAYNRGLGAVYNDYYMPQYHRVMAKEIPAIKGMEGYAFDADEFFCKAQSEVMAFTRETTLRMQAYADDTTLDYDRNAAINVKMVMGDYFIHKKPSWIGSVLLIDDEINCLNSVKAIHKHRGAPFPLHTIHVKDVTHAADPFVEENFQHAKQEYQDDIGHFLNQLPAGQRPPRESLNAILKSIATILSNINATALERIQEELAQAIMTGQSPFITLEKIQSIANENINNSPRRLSEIVKKGISLFSNKAQFVDSVFTAIQNIKLDNLDESERALAELDSQKPKSKSSRSSRISRGSSGSSGSNNE